MLPSIITFLQSSAAGLGSALAPFAAAIAVFGAAFGISKIGKSAMEAIARQPEAAGDVRSAMLLSAALIEGAALFAIVVCFMAL